MTVRHHFTTHRWNTPYQRIFLLDRWWLPWGPPILTHWGILRIVWCLGTRVTFSWTRRIQVFCDWGRLWTEKRETPIDCRFGPLTGYSTLTLRSRSRYAIAVAHTIYRHKFWIISSTPLRPPKYPDPLGVCEYEYEGSFRYAVCNSTYCVRRLMIREDFRLRPDRPWGPPKLL